MWPVTERFLKEIRRSHKVVTHADVFIDGNYQATIYPEDGTVTADSRRAVRRTLSLTVIDPDGSLTPSQDARTGLLTPFGAEIKLYRGVQYDDGTNEMVPIGVFVITDVAIDEDDGGKILNITGSDRSIRIERNKFVNAFAISEDTPVESAVTSILRDRWTDVEVDFPATGTKTSKIVVDSGGQDDPWRMAIKIAESAGYDLAFDVDGIARMRVTPDPLEETPVAIYADGDDAVITQLSRKFESAKSPNGVVVSAQSSSGALPIRVVAWDDNPNSVTYRFGPYGQVPMFYSNSAIKTTAQAQEVAVAFLRKILGQAEAIEWAQIVNPAHDVLDVVRIIRDPLDLAVVLDRIDIPLKADEIMRATARVWEITNG